MTTSEFKRILTKMADAHFDAGEWDQEMLGPYEDAVRRADVALAACFEAFRREQEQKSELLAALKFMLEHRELQLQMAGVTRKADDVERAKAAIAKAEGCR